MPASQSPALSISTPVSSNFSAVSCHSVQCGPHARPATHARSSRHQAAAAHIASASSILPYPLSIPQRNTASSLPRSVRQKCDKSPSTRDSITVPCPDAASHDAPPHKAPSHQPSPVRQTADAAGAKPHPDTALHTAARPKTDAALLEQMVTLRRAGKSLRHIGRQTGRCMEGVRQALLRYEQARAETPAQYAQEEDWHEPLRDPDPLPAGHPIATQAIWRGLEHWRDVV
ncbi:hypothetical protein [Acetobacter persici]|uniref:hypothetical protein n=1 Tax=Acetobacter persici TaxID=1076596 RepID=UPI001BABD239|nr:hypothetical protein [Acetobacter persici]MBS0962940.1 hypothetical protein [Acetobacter persici]